MSREVVRNWGWGNMIKIYLYKKLSHKNLLQLYNMINFISLKHLAKAGRISVLSRIL